MQKMFHEKGGHVFFLVARILIGLLFLQHGLQKIFGFFGGPAVDLFSVTGIAGLIELVGGILLAVGILTKLVLLVSAVMMLVAYFTVHIPQGIIPLTNNGELALVYFAAFMALFAYSIKHAEVSPHFWRRMLRR